MTGLLHIKGLSKTSEEPKLQNIWVPVSIGRSPDPRRGPARLLVRRAAPKSEVAVPGASWA